MSRTKKKRALTINNILLACDGKTSVRYSAAISLSKENLIRNRCSNEDWLVHASRWNWEDERGRRATDVTNDKTIEDMKYDFSFDLLIFFR